MLQIWACFKKCRLVKCQKRSAFCERRKRKERFSFGLATRQTAPVRALKVEELLPVMPGFFEAGVVELLFQAIHSCYVRWVINNGSKVVQRSRKMEKLLCSQISVNIPAYAEVLL